MGAKHSPGPWEAVDSLTVRGPFEAGNPEKAGFMIASLPAYRSTGDAKLIAAAPELLEALRKLITISDEAYTVEGVSMHPFITEAKALVAKVDGGEK